MDETTLKTVGRFSRVLARKYRGVLDEDDLYQEGWVAGLSSLRKINPAGKSHMISYLYRRIRGGMTNASISMQRSKKRERNIGFKTTCKRWNGRHLIQARDNNTLVAHEILDAAPIRYRQILHELYWNGLSTRDVAKKYGLPHWRVAQDRRTALDWVIQFWGIT